MPGDLSSHNVTHPCQRKWQPATDEIQRTESELREYDASRMPLEQARARSKKKHEDARKELKDMEVRPNSNCG